MRRLIVFLQQSSVEWCSSLWLHLVSEVRDNFLSRHEIKPVLQAQQALRARPRI